jgi:RNA polymerase-binding transcription factor DksA
MGSDEALTPQQIEHFRTLLVEERTAAEARMEERAAEIPATVRQDDETGDYTDDGAALAERERFLVENEFDGELVGKIDHALERLGEGTYGVSEVSGRRIPVERLEAVPWATTLSDEGPIEDE